MVETLRSISITKVEKLAPFASPSRYYRGGLFTFYTLTLRWKSQKWSSTTTFVVVFHIKPGGKQRFARRLAYPTFLKTVKSVQTESAPGTIKLPLETVASHNPTTATYYRGRIVVLNTLIHIILVLCSHGRDSGNFIVDGGGWNSYDVDKK